MSIGKEELEAVTRVINSGCLSGYQGNWSDNFYGGPEVKALEQEWAEYFGVKHAIACNSATSGLWMALAAIGLQQLPINNSETENANEIIYDDLMPNEVVVTPYSMTCSASIPLHFGAKPVFADIERDYFCLDPVSVESKITPATRAIIVVDLFGQPYDADAINAIAETYSKKYGHKIYVIEDAAQAIGATYKGHYAGALGDIGVYSLNRHKPIQCGEGGVVVTNDDDLADKLRLAMNHAEAVTNDMCRKGEVTPDHYLCSMVGMNLRMTELSAAVAREQLKKLDGILKTVRSYAIYFTVKVRPECEHAYYRYAFTNPSESLTFMLDTGREIQTICGTYSADTGGKIGELSAFNTKRHYIKPIYNMPLFQSLGYPQDLCPVCEAVEKDIVLAWLKEEP